MKKIVRLTESKLVELIRGIVSEQQVNAYTPEEVKRLQALNAYNSNLLDLKRKGKITPGQYMQKYNAANPKNKIKSPNEKTIPYVTSTRFLPPEIKPDEEVTKPEPAPEPEEKPIYTEPEPEEEIEPVAPPQLQESIKRTLRMFSRMK
jgi:hypothetical protein